MVSDEDVGNLWLAQALWDLGAIQFGDFTIGRTTEHSPIYVNLRLLISNPAALARAAGVMLDEIQTLQAMRHPQVSEFQRVCGIPFGGLHLATAFSLRSRVPMVYIHPAKERNGRRIFVEGNFNPEETFLLVDDLVTSGGGIIEAAAFLKQNARADVRDVLVLLDREEGARALLKKEGYNLINILGMETMLNYLMAKGLIQEDQYKRSIDYVQTRRAQRTG